MSKDALLACQRTKNQHVPDDISRVLSKCFLDTNASKLPDGSFNVLYAERASLIDELQSSANHVVWGRRGTGKTHLINAFVERINTNSQLEEVAIYISCDKMAHDTPKLLPQFSTEESRVKYFANETYRNFMNSLCDQLVKETVKLLKQKKQPKLSKQEFSKYLKRVEERILQLMEVCDKGVPKLTHISAKITQTEANESEQKIGLSVGAESSSNTVSGFLKGILSKANHRNKRTSAATEEDFQYTQFFPAIRQAVTNLISEMDINCVYVCIDELWLIDDKSNISFQPYFLDNIRQSLGVQKKLSVKVVSIRETTNLNNKVGVRKRYGMQAGHDINELAYLDPIQNKMSMLHGTFKEMIAKRINYYIDKESQDLEPYSQYQHSRKSVYTAEQLINMIFKEERNLVSLVNMSHGIPRNFLNILNTCLRKLEYNISSNYIHNYLISEVVIDFYKNEHRSDILLNGDNTVFNAICDYVSKSKQYFFLIENKEAERLKSELNTLLYNEIIHRIPSAETPTTIMNSYKAYYVDIGMYFLYMREKRDHDYMKLVNDFDLLMPADLEHSYSSYMVNLDRVSNGIVKCPHCQAEFAKNHPVYQKCGVCIECAQ